VTAPTDTIPATVVAKDGWLPAVGNIVAADDGGAYRVLTRASRSSRAASSAVTLVRINWSDVAGIDDEWIWHATL